MTVHPRALQAAERHVVGAAADRHPYTPTVALVTWAEGDLARCPTQIADVRCIYPRYHPGSCGVLVLSDTGLTFTVAFGQAGTSGAPNVDTDGLGVWTRAIEVGAALEAQLAAVADLHAGSDIGIGEDHHVRWCAECDTKWPCPTARAIDTFADDLVDVTEGDS